MTTAIRRKGQVPVQTTKPPQTAVSMNGGSRLSIATVPDMRFARGYQHRKVNGVEDFTIYDTAMANTLNVLLEGPTGPGKTRCSLAYAAERGLLFYSVPSNVGVEPSQLFGKFVPNAAGGWTWADGGVTAVIRNGGLLLINEINFMPERVATVLFGLLDIRREIVLLDHHGEVVRAHTPGANQACWCSDGIDCTKGVLIVADMNPEYEGTRPLNKALRNRFAVQLDWDYDRDVESMLVKSQVLLDLAYKMRGQDTYETPIATNMLQEFERLVKLFGLDFAIGNFIQHFTLDERASVMEVFRVERQRLEDDIMAESFEDGFGDVFGHSKAEWSFPARKKKGAKAA